MSGMGSGFNSTLGLAAAAASHEASSLSSLAAAAAASAVAAMGPTPGAAASGCCEEFYGFLPCSLSVGGSFFLILIYGSLLLLGAKNISDGSELLLEVLDPGIVGGLLLPILGALPDSIIILFSGLGGTREEAQKEVIVGMGTLVGSTVMLLTLAWSLSLLIGRCDIGPNGKAKDFTRSDEMDMMNTGVTTDATSIDNAWIMLIALLPLLIAQLPSMLGFQQTSVVIFIAFLLSILLLLAYCAYQVAVPELQMRRIKAAREKLVKSHSVRLLLHLAKDNNEGSILDSDGNVNEETLVSMFNRFDINRDGHIDEDEIKMLILAVSVGMSGYVPRESDVAFYMQHFDRDKSSTITIEEFIDGMNHWVAQVQHDKGGHHHLTAGAPSSPVPGSPHRVRHAPRVADFVPVQSPLSRYPSGSVMDGEDYREYLGKALMPKNEEGEVDHEALEDVNEEEGEEGGGEEEDIPKEKLVFDAIMLLLLGTLLLVTFSDPMVGVIASFAEASGIPAFFVSFVITPMASNASELYSSLIFASKMRRRNITLTYAQIYGAVTMNGTMCLGVFLGLVFCRGLFWDFSAEVTVMFGVILIMGLVGTSNTTFRSWLAFPVLLLYPLTLLVVGYLDFVLGWN